MLTVIVVHGTLNVFADRRQIGLKLGKNGHLIRECEKVFQMPGDFFRKSDFFELFPKRAELFPMLLNCATEFNVQCRVLDG